MFIYLLELTSFIFFHLISQKSRYSEKAFLVEGLKILRKKGYHHSSRRTLDRRFRALFGTSPKVCRILWDKVYEESTPRGAKPKHLLWALLFCRVYNTEHVNASMAGCDEKTFRKWSWVFVEAISDLQHEVVSLIILFTIHFTLTISF